MRQLAVMTVSDLRQRIRDRSVIIFALVVPLALMFVFDLTLGDTDEVQLDSIDVALAIPADDELAAVVAEAAFANDVVDVRLTELAADDVRPHVESGGAALGIVIPQGFSESMTNGDGPAVQVIEGTDVGLEGTVVLSIMQGALDQLTAGTVAATAGAQLGLPPEELAGVAEAAATQGPQIDLAEGTASTEQLSGSATLVAGQAGLFLLFTVGFGVLGLVAERKQGTLARLRSMPMRPGLVVAAKAATSFILGVVATAVLLTVGGLLFDVAFGSPVAVGVLVVCVVAAAVSLMFVIARVARDAEQANIMQSILALVLGMAAGAFFPITGEGVLGQLLDLNPIAAFIRGLGITFGGGGLGDVGVPVLIMLGFAVVCVAASRLLPDRGADL